MRAHWLVVATVGCSSSSCGCGGGGATDAGGGADAAAVADGSSIAGDAGVPSTEVLEHHGGPTRAGVYLAPGFTRAAVAGLRPDTGFDARMSGPTYAQPLLVTGGSGALLVVATERNQVSVFDAGTGAAAWQRVLAPPVPRSALPCGNIDPLGVTGTPVIDPETRTIYLDAMVQDGGPRHRIYALAVDGGATRAGWPVDVNGAQPGFDSRVQNQRGALALLAGRVYVPYGGHWGDCGDYHGWVIGVDTAHPGTVGGWATRARGGGAWAPSGLAADRAALYVATGNTFGAATWSDGEAILRLGPGPTFSRALEDYFAPANWMALDDGDIDIGGTGPVLFEVAGAPRTIALGKDGKAYLLDRARLGGVGAPPA